jgi:prepilin-type N-terminal cleavage/methylation domain-containing protein
VRQSFRSQGFTIIEVLIALAILLIAVTILSSSVIGSVRTDRNSGQRTQAVEYLNYIGRYAVEGSSKVLPTSPATQKDLAYGTFATAFPDILSPGGFSSPALYRATIKDAGTVTLAGVSGSRYDLTVCWRDGSSESCITGTTVGPNSADKSLVN